MMQTNKKPLITKYDEKEVKLSSRQNSVMWLQFCMTLIKKMKHQIYGLFLNNNPQITQIKSIDNSLINEISSIKAIDTLDNEIEVDGLAVLQSGIFQQYQLYVNTLIQQQSLLLTQQHYQLISQQCQVLHIQSNLKQNLNIQAEIDNLDEFQPHKNLYIEQKDSDIGQKIKRQRQQVNKIVISLLNRLKTNKYIHGVQEQQSQNSQQSKLNQIQNLINLLNNQQNMPIDQHKISILLSPNSLTIKLISQQQQSQSHESQQTGKQTLANNKHSTIYSPQKLQSLESQQQSQQQQQQQQSQSNTNRYLSAQRQLQFLIKQKQLNKKLQQSHQQIEQLKSLLQLKQLQLTEKLQQVNQLNKNIDKLNLLQNKQYKVSLLKHKIQKQSLIRQFSLQRERDSLQLFIQKQNINANLNLDSTLNSSNLKSYHLGLNSTLKDKSKNIINTQRTQESSNLTDQNSTLNQIN